MFFPFFLFEFVLVMGRLGHVGHGRAHWACEAEQPRQRQAGRSSIGYGHLWQKSTRMTSMTAAQHVKKSEVQWAVALVALALTLEFAD